MLPVSDAFMRAVRGDDQVWRGVVSMGIYDTTAKRDCTTASTAAQSFSDIDNTLDSDTALKSYGTCEQDQFRTDGSFYLFPDNPAPINWGFWSLQMSGADGSFADPPTVTYSFTGPHSSIGLTLTCAGVVENLTVSAYSGETLLKEEAFSNQNTSLLILDFPVENYDRLVIVVTKVEPYHYFKLLEVQFGIEYLYQDADLSGIDLLEEIDLMSNTLSANELTVTLNNLDQRFNMFNPGNDQRFLQERQEITAKLGLKVGEGFEYLPLGKFYLSDWHSPSELTTKFVADDSISLMTGNYYHSKLYQDAPAEMILTDLFDDMNLYDDRGNPMYYIHDNVKGILLSGYIEPTDYRSALQRIAFACRAVVRVDRYGVVLVYRATEETRNSIVIDQYTIYHGIPRTGTIGAGQLPAIPLDTAPVPTPMVIDRSLSKAPKAALGTYYDRVELERYSWKLKPETETLYEGVLEGNCTVVFSSYPAAQITVAGSYASMTAYACAVDLKGCSGAIAVTGKVYEAISEIVVKSLPQTASRLRPNTLNVQGINLISRLDTAQEVSGWLLEELQNRVTQSFQWVVNPSVEASDYVQLETQFGELRPGQVTKMHLTYTGGLTGESEVVG